MRKKVTYLLVGAWNTLFGYGVFALLQLTVGRFVHYLAILVAAQLLAILNAYVAYRRLVFKVRGQVLRDLVRFSLVYLVALGANVALLPVLVETAGLPILLAQGVVVAGTVVASFFAHQSISFRRPRVPDAAGADPV